ncbi:MAG: hypothetical protein ACE5G1_06170 [bacterium]
MPGYQLVERKYLSPPLAEGRGIKANSRRIGFLDFLRELSQDDFPYHEETSLLVVGLEDVLLFARPDMEQMAIKIHKLLQKSARDFERYDCAWVQIMFRNELKRGETLNVIYPGQVKIPIYLIFGSPAASMENGNVCYRCSFNLSSIS